jgi:integrase
MSRRLSNVRLFAIHLHGIDPATQVPPADILPGRSHRATPYLYSAQEISALMTATTTLRGSHRRATYRTLIGLLAATGMRIGEAIGLDRDDFDAMSGVVTIRNGKFGKSRELPLHPSTVGALGDYLCRADRPRQTPNVPALLLSPTGTRLLYTNVQNTFQRLVRHCGITPRSAACRPRLHDLRHGFAVNTILDAYRDDGDPGARLAILSTYLGHINPAHTYWYLSASPELLTLAGDRLERHLGGGA